MKIFYNERQEFVLYDFYLLGHENANCHFCSSALEGLKKNQLHQKTVLLCTRYIKELHLIHEMGLAIPGNSGEADIQIIARIRKSKNEKIKVSSSLFS